MSVWEHWGSGGNASTVLACALQQCKQWAVLCTASGCVAADQCCSFTPHVYLVSACLSVCPLFVNAAVVSPSSRGPAVLICDALLPGASSS